MILQPLPLRKIALFTEDDDEYISASFFLTLVNKAPDIFDNRYAWWYISPAFCNVASLTALVTVNTSLQI